jgi:hypothetical protein
VQERKIGVGRLDGNRRERCLSGYYTSPSKIKISCLLRKKNVPFAISGRVASALLTGGCVLVVAKLFPGMEDFHFRGEFDC